MAKRQNGISLIELVIFMVIVGVALVGIVSAINYNVQHSADAVVKKQALAIAESMLEEVMLQNFTDPDGSGVEASRDLYDNIQDYNNYCMATTGCSETKIRDITGTEIALLTSGRYTVNVVVAASDLGPAPNLITTASGKALRITVTVTGPFSTTVLLEGYRTDYGT